MAASGPLPPRTTWYSPEPRKARRRLPLRDPLGARDVRVGGEGKRALSPEQRSGNGWKAGKSKALACPLLALPATVGWVVTWLGMLAWPPRRGRRP